MKDNTLHPYLRYTSLKQSSFYTMRKSTLTLIVRRKLTLEISFICTIIENDLNSLYILEENFTGSFQTKVKCKR